jgi:hypothetical protein
MPETSPVTLPRFACPTPDFYTKNLRKNQGLRVLNSWDDGGGMIYIYSLNVIEIHTTL